MQKQEDEKLERRLHQVMEQIQPDEDAKDRMYLEIMRRASVAETPPAKPKPWYLRWQTSAGACTAALLCVVVVAAAVHGRMPQGGTGQLDIVSPTVTTQASELSADTEQSDETETRPQTETGVTVYSAEITAGTAAGNASAAAESSTVPAEDEIVSPVSPEITVPQKPQQQETQPVVQTTAAAMTVPKAETTAAPETVTEPPATTASSVETVPIRQNIYLYYKLTWEGNPYDTDYMEVSSSSLDQYLGYGVTRGNDVEDTYTVLIYSIVGVDPVQQVAVQYAGEEKYYVFTIQ